MNDAMEEQQNRKRKTMYDSDKNELNLYTLKNLK